MKEFWRKLVSRIMLPEEEDSTKKEGVSKFRIAKAYRKLRFISFRFLKDAFLMICGITAAAFGLESFLLPAKFIDGGVIGIALLTSGLTDLPLGWLIFLLSIPFVILGYSTIGKQFALKTAISILGLALMLSNFNFPEVTDEKLLVAVFGGFFLGAGTGLSMRGGSVIDGTEVLAIYLGKKFGLSIGDVIIFINIIIFSAAAYLLSIETALYSMITYFAASKTIDFIIEGIEEYIAVDIVSVHSEEIREMILYKMRRGVTVYKGERGVKHEEMSDKLDIIRTVITRLELNELNTEIIKIDSHAFVVMTSVKDAKGGMIKRRPLH